MDKSTFQQKLQQYKDMVYRIAYTYLRNTADAEDVSQETFLKFYQLSKPFTDTGLEKAWLIRDPQRLPQPPEICLVQPESRLQRNSGAVLRPHRQPAL